LYVQLYAKIHAKSQRKYEPDRRQTAEIKDAVSDNTWMIIQVGDNHKLQCGQGRSKEKRGPLQTPVRGPFASPRTHQNAVFIMHTEADCSQ